MSDLPPLPVQFPQKRCSIRSALISRLRRQLSPDGEAFLLFQSRQHPRLGLNDSAQPRLNIDLRLPAVDLAGVGVVALAELVDLVVQDLRFDAVGPPYSSGYLAQ